MSIIQVPSPNFFTGRKTFKPIAIVIHIMEGTLADTDSWFKSPGSKVSAHYGVGKNGEIHQFVQETNSAWHAGRVNAPTWQLLQPAGNNLYYNPNYYTIGIEHEGNESTTWTPAMYLASSGLIRDISNRWNIPLDRNHLVGHHEIYAIKACPGGQVNLNTLIAMATDPSVVPPPAGQSMPAPQKILQPGKAVATTRLNIRQRPNRNQAPLGTVDTGATLAFDGFTEEGESISGNSKWFYTATGQWFWSGGVQ